MGQIPFTYKPLGPPLLKENGYPRSFYDNIVKQFLQNKFERTQKPAADDQKRYTFRIPYIGNASLLFKRKLKKLFKSRDVDINSTSYFRLPKLVATFH